MFCGDHIFLRCPGVASLKEARVDPSEKASLLLRAVNHGIEIEGVSLDLLLDGNRIGSTKTNSKGYRGSACVSHKANCKRYALPRRTSKGRTRHWWKRLGRKVCVDRENANGRKDEVFQFPEIFRVFLRWLLRYCVCVLLCVVLLLCGCVVVGLLGCSVHNCSARCAPCWFGRCRDFTMYVSYVVEMMHLLTYDANNITQIKNEQICDQKR